MATDDTTASAAGPLEALGLSAQVLMAARAVRIISTLEANAIQLAAAVLRWVLWITLGRVWRRPSTPGQQIGKAATAASVHNNEQMRALCKADTVNCTALLPKWVTCRWCSTHKRQLTVRVMINITSTTASSIGAGIQADCRSFVCATMPSSGVPGVRKRMACQSTARLLGRFPTPCMIKRMRALALSSIPNTATHRGTVSSMAQQGQSIDI